MADDFTHIPLSKPETEQPAYPRSMSSAVSPREERAGGRAPHRTAPAKAPGEDEIVVEAGMWTVFNRRLLRLVDRASR